MRPASPGALVLLLALSACGGAGGSFAEDYNEAVMPLAELGANPGSEPRDYDRLARRTRQTRRNLARLDPPEEARDELGVLVRRLDDVTASLSAVARAARGDDVVRERRAARGLVRSSRGVQEAETALKRAVEG